ncbi:MAG: aminotransferase class I/II-fold pyridoxal phosphate-dependent enzyme [Acidimicrobiia bacterium]
MHVNPVLSQLGTYPIAEVKARVTARQEQGLEVIDFSIGDPIEPTPEFITTTMRDAIPVVSQYPTAGGRRDVREGIAGYVKRRFGVAANAETQVIPTSGSKEAIFNAHFAFVDRDADALVAFPSPGYPVYERGALFAGARTYKAVLSGDFVLRAADIPDSIWSEAQMLWICTPHNPAGSVTTASELDDLITACRANDVLLLSDECYADIYDDVVYPDGPHSVLERAGTGFKGVLSFLSLSKRSGMTGYRSGAIVGDAEAITALKALRSTTGTASPDFTQQAAAAAWSDDHHAAERRALFVEKRRVLSEAFDGTDCAVVESSAGLYLWVRVSDDLAVSEQLLEHGIVVSPGRFFGEGGEGYIRMALVPGLEECEAAAHAVRGALVGDRDKDVAHVER